jgi:hypothetical protein
MADRGETLDGLDGGSLETTRISLAVDEPNGQAFSVGESTLVELDRRIGMR